MEWFDVLSTEGRAKYAMITINNGNCICEYCGIIGGIEVFVLLGKCPSCNKLMINRIQSQKIDRKIANNCRV